MKRAPLFVVGYDISCDRERRSVDRVLAGVGHRLQKSLYQARLTRADLQRLDARLKALGLCTGWVRMYRVAESSPPRSFGQVPTDPDAGLVFVV